MDDRRKKKEKLQQRRQKCPADLERVQISKEMKNALKTKMAAVRRQHALPSLRWIGCT